MKRKKDGLFVRDSLWSTVCRSGYSVIPPAVRARVSVEQASTFGWARFVGLDGERIGMKTFGASAPLKELQKKFGFTVENVVAAAKKQLAKERSQK